MRRAGHKRIRKEQRGAPSPTHQSSHTNTRTQIAVLPDRAWEDLVLHTKNARTARIHPQWARKRDTPPPPPVQSHGQQDTTTARCRHTKHSERTITQRATRAEADPHPSMTRCPTPCGHTECTLSSIELTRRPSLKYASVIGGSWNTIE
ncbi:exo-alpha-sialidase [Trypanosoma cruzi]|nr:exo-alpha-sialidase [Trypanosoma cruzi]